VSTGPGNTAFTRMPDAANSAAVTWVRPRSAHFDEPYAAWFGNGRMAPVLQVLTMDAPSDSRKCGNAVWMPRNGPRQLTRQLPSKPAAVSSDSEAQCSTPALLTRVLNAPNRATVVATAAAHWSASVTFRGIAMTASSPSASTVALTSSTIRSHAATRNPSLCSRRTIAAP